MAERQAGILVKLVNPAAVKQHDGLKYSDDQHDAFWLAHLMRPGILPTGYIDPKPERTIRDLLRRRLFLVRSASSQLISVQSQIWRSTGIRIASAELKKTTFQIRLEEGYVYQAIQAGLTVYRAIQQEIQQLQQSAFDAVKLSDEYKILPTTTGIGKILGLTIMLETGDIHRFAGPGNYASYCRCVDSGRQQQRQEERQRQREGRQSVFVGPAFSEAAHFAVRYAPLAQRFYERKKARTNGIIALRAVARKLARTTGR